MRGLFTAGVIDVMLEEGIRYDGIVGVSAGSSFGCNYKSHQPGRVLRYNLRFGKDPRYMGLRSLLKTGNLVGAEFAYHTLPLKLDIFDIETFEKDPTEFHVVCTDVTTGEPVYHVMDRVDYDSLEWLRASASMPIVTKPVRVDDGHLLLDGGISDSIPLKYFQSKGFGRNVIVLTQPKDYRKTPAKAWVFKLFMKKYPKIVEAMARRYEMYNAQLEYVDSQVREGNSFVIAPEKPLPIGRVEMNPEKMKAVYKSGRDECRRLMTELKAFLAGS